ncbi:MAG TPA: VOC family protein [Kribbella sp.]|uniref:VOC family protein n=1 Tax=Kribbella sp. TaxID=1871183 RepID=UPI002D782B97|nr:VOC family protein [Kribbella sp.]HET6298948.1 VOC family protein [Kribbella sp.]
MGVGLTKIRQVKVPVTDLVRSMRWYQALLGLELVAEFTEDGVVRGVVLLDRPGGFVIALRDREVVPGRPNFAGFDLVGFGVESPQVLHQLVEDCERLGFDHEPIHDRGEYGQALDITDPDGTVLRFLWDHETVDDTFLGMEFTADGPPTMYDVPRLPR